MTALTCRDVIMDVDNWLAEIARDRTRAALGRLLRAIASPAVVTSAPGELTYEPLVNGETAADRSHRGSQPISNVDEDAEDDDPLEDDDGG